MKIYKYPLERVAQQYLELPADYRILDIQYQGADLVLWAAVTPAPPTVQVRFDIVPTGGDIDERELPHYVKTVQELGGALIWHVFARTL